MELFYIVAVQLQFGDCTVLGIGEGKLEFTLNGSTFFPGQQITGHASLALNQPTIARELRAEFYGEIKKGKHYERIFEVRQQLAPGKTFQSGESFDFSLTIPSNALPPNIEGFFGSVASFLYSLSPPRWFVSASLDMPNKFDISKRIRVQLMRPPGTPSQTAEEYAKQQGIPGGGPQVRTWGMK